jgi:phage terminase large subunit-like protein
VNQLSHITAENLSKLSDREAEQLLEALEAQHLDVCKDEMTEYARYIEVPGTPSPASKDTLAELLKQKEAMRRRADGQGWEQPEAIEGEPDVPEEEFYPRQLEPAVHQDLIMNSIQALIEEEPVTGLLANGHKGVIPEGLMLFMPPGSAKSSYASVVAPTWIMGRWPGIDVIGLSYAADLAKRFGRRARSVCRSMRFQEVFDCTVTGDNQAVDQWSLTNGSTYRAVGILGGVTGNRADVALWDDPIAGREEAESEIIRDKTNVAMRDDVFTRLKPRGKVIGITTRWHEDDPAGHLLGEDWEGQSGLWKGTDGRWWLVLCVTLLADRDDDPLGREMGERLWPEWFTERHVELARQSGERAWMSLYQQKPAATEGVILLKRYWRCWPHGKPEPDEAQLEDPSKTEPMRNWTQSALVYDTAVEDGQDNDYSAMSAWAAFGRTPKADRRLGKAQEEEQQNLLLLGGWRGKVQAVDLFKIVESHVEFFKPDHIIVEKKASGHQLLQELRRRRPRYTDLGQVHYVSIHEWTPPFPPGANGKVPRLHNAAVLLEQGNVWYMPGPTNAAIIKECASAPNGKHDDWADTVTSMLIWSRSINLLEVAQDVLHKDEEETAEREEREFLEDDRRLYGALRTRPSSNAARSLYGRISRSSRHWED